MEEQSSPTIEELYRLEPPSPWSRTLPEQYFREFKQVLIRNYFDNDHQLLSLDAGKRDLAYHLYVRLYQCHDLMIPWVNAAFPLHDKSVIEVGCGTGSTTAALALHAGSVHAFDIADGSLVCAKDRCDLLGLTNVEIEGLAKDWIERFASREIGPAPNSAQVIICYAVLEHMLPHERLAFLRSAWRTLEPGGILVIFETPNRLHFYDWHSSWLVFFDVLPDDLASAYLSRTTREDTPADIISQELTDFDEGKRERLYRWGRGVSFHEFELAIGFENMTVIADSNSKHAFPRDSYCKRNVPFEDTLKRVLKEHAPSVPGGFCCPSLDLVIQKRG